MPTGLEFAVLPSPWADPLEARGPTATSTNDDPTVVTGVVTVWLAAAGVGRFGGDTTVACATVAVDAADVAVVGMRPAAACGALRPRPVPTGAAMSGSGPFSASPMTVRSFADRSRRTWPVASNGYMTEDVSGL